MTDQFRNYASRHELWSSGDRILLAVSGGVDSMVMLDLFSKAGVTLGVAHANFQLRGKGADQDEAFVEAYCRKHGIQFYSQSFETKNYAEASGLSVQMAAREIRYAWFDELLEQHQYHYLATAHHLNDNLETVLLRWVKGASLEQLTGIQPKNGKLIRPLLFATRLEIEEYAKKEKIKWREDPTNAADDYQRNFVRNQVIPLLKGINPSLESTFERSVGKLNSAHELMRRGLEQLKDQITGTEGDTFFIDRNVLRLLRFPVVVCHECLRSFGFEWEVCFQLVESLDGQTGKQFLSHTHVAVMDRERILVTPRVEWNDEILIEEGQDLAVWGPWRLSISRHPGAKVDKRMEAASLDLSKVRFPIRWRKWKNGDQMIPIGLGHRKKVSDLLIDEKIPLSAKAVVTVLVSQEEIIWVVGHRVDDRFKVTPSTEAVLHLLVQPMTSDK